MDHPENEPKQDEIEQVERAEDEVALEDLDIPEDLKAELLRELDGFKEGDDARKRSGPSRRP
jgi:hypothetical protein